MAFGAAIAAGIQGGSTMQQSHESQAMAWKQMLFQKKMSDTAVRRSVRDMRAAGINPLLAVTPGGGASSPGGAMGSVGSGLSGVNMMGGSAAERWKEEKKLMQQETWKRKNERTLIAANVNHTNLQNELLKAQLPGARLEAYIDKSGAGQWGRLIKRFSPVVPNVGVSTSTTHRR